MHAHENESGRTQQVLGVSTVCAPPPSVPVARGRWRGRAPRHMSVAGPPPVAAGTPGLHPDGPPTPRAPLGLEHDTGVEHHPSGWGGGECVSSAKNWAGCVLADNLNALGKLGHLAPDQALGNTHPDPATPRMPSRRLYCVPDADPVDVPRRDTQRRASPAPHGSDDPRPLPTPASVPGPPLDGERPRQSSPATPPPHGAAFFRGVVTRPLPCERPPQPGGE